MIIDVNALQGSTQQEPQFQVIFMSWTWPHRSSSKPQPQLHNHNNFQPQCDVIFVALILIIQRWVVEEVKGSPPSTRFGHAQVFSVRNATHLPHLQLNCSIHTSGNYWRLCLCLWRQGFDDGTFRQNFKQNLPVKIFTIPVGMLILSRSMGFLWTTCTSTTQKQGKFIKETLCCSFCFSVQKNNSLVSKIKCYSHTSYLSQTPQTVSV